MNSKLVFLFRGVVMDFALTSSTAGSTKVVFAMLGSLYQLIYIFLLGFLKTLLIRLNGGNANPSSRSHECCMAPISKLIGYGFQAIKVHEIGAKLVSNWEQNMLCTKS